LRYWYVPAAAALAAGIAFAIVTVVDMVVEEPESEVAPADSTTVFVQTPLPTPAVSPTPASTTTPGTPGATETTGGALRAGQTVIVTGTGDCLNVRDAPSLEAAIITCVPDGTSLVIVEGPEPSAGRNWWRVDVAGEQGWAAEEYLRAS